MTCWRRLRDWLGDEGLADRASDRAKLDGDKGYDFPGCRRLLLEHAPMSQPL